MKKRPLGSTGEHLSLVGLGGILVAEMPQEEANRIVAEAVDRGVNYFDVAPTYGNAQERLGPALEPCRKQVFLACKTAERDKEKSAVELENSLRLLRTDHVDLYQLHGLTSVEEVERIFAPGGAMETFREAKRAGKARFLGFSAHSMEAAEEALKRFRFDSVLFPFNFVCWHHGFGPKVMEAAKARGAARLALKSMARTNWPQEGERRYKKCWYQPFDQWGEVELALRWTLSQDVTAAIPPGEPELFRMALKVAENFYPLSIEELDQLRATAQTIKPIFSPQA
jgi:predicted aldo/keto reductase-like oxidoreductase